jgi:hypothetical protein
MAEQVISPGVFMNENDQRNNRDERKEILNN